MRWTFMLFVFMAAATGAAAEKPEPTFSPPPGWVADPADDGVPSWFGGSLQKQMISIVEKPSAKGLVPEADDRKFIEITKLQRKAAHQLAQITEWQVKTIERKKLRSGYRIQLAGTYLDYKKELIRFEEWKYYLRDGYSEIHFSELAVPDAGQGSDLTRAQIAEIMGRYRPFGSPD